MDMNVFCLVQTSIDDEAKAEAIAEALVTQRLAACVQIAPVRSVYIWKGAVAREKEFVLSAKARRADFDAVCAAIKALHSYEVPEIIAVPFTGEEAYMEWVWRETERRRSE